MEMRSEDDSSKVVFFPVRRGLWTESASFLLLFFTRIFMLYRISPAAFLAIMFVIGCAPEGPKTGTVKGKVTLDGKSLDTGKIVFDEGPSVPVAELDIKNGEYSGTVTAGKKTVRINSFKKGVAPKDMSGPAYENVVGENLIPSKFNTASTETREVKQGSNEFTFDLKSK